MKEENGACLQPALCATCNPDTGCAVRVGDAAAQGTEVEFAMSISGIEYKDRGSLARLSCICVPGLHPKFL